MHHTRTNRQLRLIGMIIVSVLMSLFWSYPAAQAVVPPGYAPVGLGDVYLALGDSLVTGTEAAGNNDDQPGYPNRLLPLLQTINSDLRLEILAQDGETSTTMIAEDGQLDEAVALIQNLRSSGERVGLVTLSIGGNDLITLLRSLNLTNPDAEFAETLSTFEANFTLILDRLLAALENQNGVRQGNLLVMTYYNPYPNFNIPGFGRLADAWVPQFNASLKEIALERGVPVAEVARAFAGNEEELLYVQRPYPVSPFEPNLETRLDYHPQPAGHRVIASEFLAVSGYRLNMYLPFVRN